MNQSHIIKKTVEQLKKTNPHKIILFGSRTSSSANEESDFDFIVVTSDDFIPKNFNEKTQLFLKINNSIKEIKKEAPIDLIVYTKPLFNKFLEQKSLFSKEIEEKGIVLYEANHAGMDK
jgi:predicted nucleotidyltransferase